MNLSPANRLGSIDEEANLKARKPDPRSNEVKIRFTPRYVKGTLARSHHRDSRPDESSSWPESASQIPKIDRRRHAQVNRIKPGKE
jgi:hypothetical protein